MTNEEFIIEMRASLAENVKRRGHTALSVSFEAALERLAKTQAEVAKLQARLTSLYVEKGLDRFK